VKRRLADVTRTEKLAWGGLILVALLARLYDLGDRPFHHDESQDAYFSWLFAEKGEYEYNPLLHPPLRFYLTAAVYTVFGDSDFTARLAPALMGTIAVGLPFLLRRQLGRLAAFGAAVLLAFGPSFLYYSRFAREDIYLAAINLALFVAIFRFISRPRRWHPALIGFLLALAFATKEATFITAGLGFVFFVAWGVMEWRSAPDRPRPLLRALARPGVEGWGWATATFVVTYVVLFTTFLTDPQHWDALYEGLDYWVSEHGKGRGEKEKYFYSVVLVAHEWPALLLGAVGAVFAVRARHMLGIFCAWMFLGQLAAYSIANERFTWLVLHPLLPLTLLAGIAIQAAWELRRRAQGRVLLALVAAGALYVAHATINANVVHRASPEEFLVTTQSSEDVPRIADRIIATTKRINARRPGTPASVTIDGAEGATFPYAWYLRDTPGVGYPDLSSQTAPPTSDIIVTTEANKLKFESQLTDYTLEKFRFRVWWVRDYGKMRPGSFVRWLVSREPWNPTGGMPEWYIVKKGS
jgi:uncharacterized protein (TIGR03663 family)